MERDVALDGLGSPAQGRALVLLIEDEPDHSELSRRGLADAPVDLEIVGDLAGAKAWLETRTPDLVISDLRLPDGGAYDLLVPGACAAPIVVMTSFGGEAQVVQAMKSGAIDYVIKSPAMFRELPLIVERGLRTARQIAEQRRTEEQLRESEARFRELASTIQDAFWLYEPRSDRVIYMSPAWQAIFDSPPASVVGPLADRLERVAPDDRPRIEQQLREASGSAPLRLEYQASTAAGELRLIEERTFPLLDAEGRAWRVAGVITDVTRQRALEDSVKRGQRLGALGQLVGGVAHELNNMLGTIIYASDQLLDQIGADPEARQLCELISNAAHRNHQLTQQLMAFGRVGARSTVAIDINRIVWDTIALLRRTLDRRILVVGDLRAAPALVMGDQTQLQTALLSLGVFARDQGGDLTFETENVVLDEAACASLPFELVPGPYVKISVLASETPDIAQLRARIFDPFASSDPTSGIGLAAVYGTAVAHRGAVAVFGGIERGSVVQLYIPSVPSVKKEVAAVASALQRGTGPVLLADDEPLVIDALGRVLVSLGYSVVVARDGQEALDQLSEQPSRFVAMICDLMMPKHHGAELIRAIRQAAPEIPLIISSGFVRDDQVSELSNLGLTAYLPKPVRRAELAAVLASATRPPPS